MSSFVVLRLLLICCEDTFLVMAYAYINPPYTWYLFICHSEINCIDAERDKQGRSEYCRVGFGVFEDVCVDVMC